ncbi:bifunctional glutamate N-acetyltransferase/amino-acid acetyltransferase ArgJ [bacterium]|nr:bifunctional glutamate N-acetyltransferase/amino-acid acetyltransferase ArgJ [bacterium]
MQAISGGITAPKGFKAAGMNCGIKRKKFDLALIVSDVPAVTAGVFTTSSTCAAPVQVSKEHLVKNNGICRGIIANSGNANASTGLQGYQDAIAMTRAAAQALGIDPVQMLVCSTGRIGVKLPIQIIETGIKTLATDSLSIQGGADAAEAILTTDRYQKVRSYTVTIDGKEVRFGAMAKGAGMIQPNMATMFAFITTDAAVDPAFLQETLAESVESTFNRITVDGDMSTNDTVLMLANGKAGNKPVSSHSAGADEFKKAVWTICHELALDMVRDGEGATKTVAITVEGAMHTASATRIARMVANSLLFKVALSGNDPNWGRIMAAIGAAGRVEADQSKISIYFDDILIVQNGQQAKSVDGAMESIVAVWCKEFFTIRIELNLGNGSDTYYTCDIGHPYIDINNH